jgi:hypothetical protein
MAKVSHSTGGGERVGVPKQRAPEEIRKTADVSRFDSAAMTNRTRIDVSYRNPLPVPRVSLWTYTERNSNSKRTP